MSIVTCLRSNSPTRVIKQSLCALLVFSHVAYMFPNYAWAENVAARTPDPAFPYFRLPESMRALRQPPVSPTHPNHPRFKDDIEIPDDIPAETTIMDTFDVEAPKNAELTLPPDARQHLMQLSPVEREAAYGLLDRTAEESWDDYLSWFGGEAPSRLQLEIVQSTGQDMALEGTATQLIVRGYGPAKALMGEVTFRLGAELVDKGSEDPTSRDYEEFQENRRRESATVERWMRALEPSMFNPLHWARLDYDRHGNVIRVVPGPAAIALQSEVMGSIMSAIGKIEGRGPTGGSRGLLQVFKNIPVNEDVGCAAVGIGGMALFGIAGKLAAWVAGRIIIGIIGAVFIAPLIRLFGELAAATSGVFYTIRAIEKVLRHASFLDSSNRLYRRLLREHMGQLGVLEREHARLQRYEEMRYRQLAKLKLRYLKQIFFVQSLSNIIGWAAAVLGGAAGAYQVWVTCKDRRWFPAKARALAGMQLYVWTREASWVRITDVVAADETDYVARVTFRNLEEMEPFVSRDPQLRRAYLGMGAVGRFDMGRYPANYANTIDSPRDLVDNAGRYEFGYGGEGGWGYSNLSNVTLLLNMGPLSVKTRSDEYPGYWHGWMPLDIYYPWGSDACDVTWRPGRDSGWCELLIAVERDWETSPSDPGPNIVLRFEFPTVRM